KITHPRGEVQSNSGIVVRRRAGGECGRQSWSSTKGRGGGMDSDTKTSRITRRKVLQQAGIGAAAAFAAPLLVSTSPAYASPGANVAGKTCATLALNGATSATGLGPCDWGDASSRPCPCHMGGFVGPVCDPQDSGRCFCFTDVKG